MDIKYVDAKGLFSIFGIPVATTKWWCWRSRKEKDFNFPYLKVGRKVLFNVNEIENWLHKINSNK